MATQQMQTVDIAYCVLKQVSVPELHYWESLTGLC